MPRKSNTKTDNYYKALPTNLRLLMESRNVTQQEIADYLGKKRQAVGYYCSGESAPDWETIVKLTNFFKVSANYLLGLSDYPTVDDKVQAVCEYTGLSVEAAERLHNDFVRIQIPDANHSNAHELMNHFIVSNTLSNLLFSAARILCLGDDAAKLIELSLQDSEPWRQAQFINMRRDMVVEKVSATEYLDAFLDEYAHYSERKKKMDDLAPFVLSNLLQEL